MGKILKYEPLNRLTLLNILNYSKLGMRPRNLAFLWKDFDLYAKILSKVKKMEHRSRVDEIILFIKLRNLAGRSR